MKRSSNHVAAPELHLVAMACDPHRDAGPLGPADFSGIDWTRLRTVASLHRAAPIVAEFVLERAPQEIVPARDREAFEALVADAQTNCLTQVVVAGQVLDGFRRHGIPVIALKGLALAERFYRLPWLRAARDIDLLVRRADQPAAERVLAEAGFRLTSGRRMPFEPFHASWIHPERRVGRMIELHWEVTPGDSPVRFDVERWWREARSAEIRAGTVLLPPADDEVVYLAWHACQGPGQAIRDLSDVARSRMAAGAGCANDGGGDCRLAAVADQAGARGFLRHVLGLSASLWGTAVPPSPPRSPWPRTALRRRLADHALSLGASLPLEDEPWWPLEHVSHLCLIDPPGGGAAFLVRRVLREFGADAAVRGEAERALLRAKALAALFVTTVLLLGWDGAKVTRWRERLGALGWAWRS